MDATDAHSTFQYAVHFSRSLPGELITQTRYARFLVFCKQPQEAENYFLRTLELDPLFDRCLVEYAQFLESQGKRDEAAKLNALSGATVDDQKINQYDYHPYCCNICPVIFISFFAAH